MRSLRAAGKRQQREINARLVLDIIQRRGPISRISLARHTGLAPSTITALSRRLMEAGLIREGGRSRGAVPGRRAIQLALNADAAYALALDLGRASSRLALVNLGGTITRDTSLPTGNIDPATIGDHLARALWEFVEGSGVPWRRIVGLGVGVPGVVDPSRRTVRSPVTLGWTAAVGLGHRLEQALRLPVLIDNDTNAAALAEQLYGAARGLNGSVIYVTIGEGVGAGVVIGGAVYRGAGQGAGEFGHTTVEGDGPLCRCGNRGCVENYASVPAILEAYRTAAGGGVSGSAPLMDAASVRAPGRREAADPRVRQLEALVETARRGSHAARDAITNAGLRLGQGLVNVANLFDPQLIVLGGLAGVLGELLLTPVRRVLAERTGIVAFDSARLVLSQLGDDGEVKGLAALVVNQRLSADQALEAVINTGGSLAARRRRNG